MKLYIYKLIVVIGLLLFVSCSNHPSVPQEYTNAEIEAKIFPDYTGVIVPCNIAPLNFRVMNRGTKSVVRITDSQGNQETFGDGMRIKIDEDIWHDMLEKSKGKSLKYEVFVEDNGKWQLYKPFEVEISNDSIDEYISYRLINPSYVAYEELRICQRNLTNFDESDIYNNMIISSESDGQCINCHSYQNYHTSNMQFHMRQGHGGTMLVYNGKAKKINLKTEKTISAGVYPSWHPTLPLIAYSTNSTGQSFHTKDKAKIEVQDAASDLILYDVENNEVSIVENDTTEFEVFPWWSPDGKTLYYCSAHFEFNDSVSRGKESSAEIVDGGDSKDAKLKKHQAEIIERYTEIKYNIYKKSFSPKTMTFGDREIVVKCDSMGKSATLPRISPDGNYLLYGLGGWGCFHIWHPDADLYVTDLRTGEMRALEEANSPQAESYHSWSSNGRWILFATRRDDGNYSRLYISYFDESGKAHKAFELPQEDPDFYTNCLKSFNVPEFMVEPVSISSQEFASVAKKDAENVNLKK